MAASLGRFLALTKKLAEIAGKRGGKSGLMAARLRTGPLLINDGKENHCPACGRHCSKSGCQVLVRHYSVAALLEKGPALPNRGDKMSAKCELTIALTGNGS